MCADALLPVMPEGSMLMIHSTISPDLVLALATEGAARGVEVIDAPVTVTRYGVADGPFVCAMIGADETGTPNGCARFSTPTRPTPCTSGGSARGCRSRSSTIW